MKVKLDDVIDALELRSEEGRYFYSTKSEEVIYVTTDDLSMAEPLEDLKTVFNVLGLRNSGMLSGIRLYMTWLSNGVRGMELFLSNS